MLSSRSPSTDTLIFAGKSFIVSVPSVTQNLGSSSILLSTFSWPLIALFLTYLATRVKMQPLLKNLCSSLLVLKASILHVALRANMASIRNVLGQYSPSPSKYSTYYISTYNNLHLYILFSIRTSFVTFQRNLDQTFGNALDKKKQRNQKKK